MRGKKLNKNGIPFYLHAILSSFFLLDKGKYLIGNEIKFNICLINN